MGEGTEMYVARALSVVSFINFLSSLVEESKAGRLSLLSLNLGEYLPGVENKSEEVLWGK